MEEALHNQVNGPMVFVNHAKAVEFVTLEIMSVPGLKGDRENFFIPFPNTWIFLVPFAVNGGGFFQSGVNAVGEILGDIVPAVLKPKFLERTLVLKTEVAVGGARLLAKMSEFVDEFPLNLRKMGGTKKDTFAHDEVDPPESSSLRIKGIPTGSIQGNR